MHPKTKLYERLREAIGKIPVIDCHDHTCGPQNAPEYKEPIAALIQGYVQSDLISAGGETHMSMLNDPKVPTATKWPVFQRLWESTEHTAYARVTKLILRDVYGEEEMSLPALERIGTKLPNLKDEKVYKAILDKAGIRCRLVNIWIDLKKYVEGEYKVYERDRMFVPLPGFHSVRSWQAVSDNAKILGRTVTSLEEYLGCCREIFRRMKEKGTIGMKDQSAYTRVISYDNASRAEAESLFNFIMEDPRRSLGWPQMKPLDDFLFHSFMRMARDLEFPVQIHTGHMAGIRNQIGKTNAAHLTSVFELHREVRFDLFHGNWPYAGELLYLCKNYPNVAIDCCWLHIIDPHYAKNLLAEALVSVPHSKVHGFGADYGDCVEYAAAHLEIARDVIASALAQVVEQEWLGEDEAKQVACDWLFNNPNRFFGLGFEPVSA